MSFRSFNSRAVFYFISNDKEKLFESESLPLNALAYPCTGARGRTPLQCRERAFRV